jgi:hypothetical protein
MRRIVLHVLPSRDPFDLVVTTASQRASESAYTREWPLRWDPPPDTLFMRATGRDLGVFGEPLPDGELQMIGGESTLPDLEEALADPATVPALVALSRASSTPADPDTVARALQTGEWPDDPAPARGAILQAAGFARQLLLAARVAAPLGRDVVWQYTGGPCRYDYP